MGLGLDFGFGGAKEKLNCKEEEGEEREQETRERERRGGSLSEWSEEVRWWRDESVDAAATANEPIWFFIFLFGLFWSLKVLKGGIGGLGLRLHMKIYLTNKAQ